MDKSQKDLAYLQINGSRFLNIARPSSKAMIKYDYADHVWTDSAIDYDPADNYYLQITKERM